MELKNQQICQTLSGKFRKLFKKVVFYQWDLISLPLAIHFALLVCKPEKENKRRSHSLKFVDCGAVVSRSTGLDPKLEQ